VISRNPARRRADLKDLLPSPLGDSFLYPTPEMLEALYDLTNKRIAELEARLEQIERSIYADENGDLEIYASGKVSILAEQNIELVGNQGVALSDTCGNFLVLSPSGLATNCTTFSGSWAFTKVGGTVTG
jgi:hypothetical protein